MFLSGLGTSISIGSFSIPAYWLLAAVAIIAGVIVAVLWLRRETVTLNIEGTSARVMVTKGRRVVRWGSMPLSAELTKDGLILDPVALGTAIKYLLSSNKAPEKKVITSLSGLHSSLRMLSLPPMPRHLRDEAILREAERAMPVPLEEVYLSWQATGVKDGEKQLFTLGVPRNLLDAEVKALQAVRIKSSIMDLKPMALVRAVNRKEALILNIEPDSFDIIVVLDAIPAIMRTLIVPQRTFTLEDRVQYLVEEVRRTVKFHDSSHPMLPLDPATPVFLTGELASDPAVAELVQASIEYPVEPLMPPLKCPSTLPIAQYAANIGLALKKVPPPRRLKVVSDLRPINLNILPEAYQPKKLPVRQALFVAAPIMICIALILPLYMLKNNAIAETTRLQAELDSLSRELALRRLDVGRIREGEDAFTQIAEMTDRLRQEHQAILDSGRGFAGSLQLVADVLPPGASLNRVNDSGDHMTLQGQAGSYSAVLDYVETLGQTGQFSSIDLRRLEKKCGADATFSIALTKVTAS